MISDIEDASAATADDHRRQIETALADVVADVGLSTASDRTGLDRDRLAALPEESDLTVEEAATVLALDGDYPDADAITAEVRDRIMLGMSTAVMDVDQLADAMTADLGPREVQQKIEGRQPMTLAEYATIIAHVEGGGPNQ
ncbi:MAG: DUF5791 family protein [Halobacteriaceae archaeon]